MTTLVHHTVAAVAAVVGNPGLRRIQLALAATALTTPAYAVALSVYAYRDGGVAAVALVGLVTFLPAGLLAPLLSVLADRQRREQVLVAALLVRGLTLAATSVCLWVDMPSALPYVLAGLSSVASRVVYPAQAALVPALARDDDELTAANALSATLDNVGAIVGPGLAGLFLVGFGPDPVIAICAVAALGAAALTRGLPASQAPDASARESLSRELAAGMMTLGRDRAIRLPASLLILQSAAFGTVSVLMVPLAIDVLKLGEAGLGLVEMALGVGGILGGTLALGLASGRRLGACLGLGIAFWGAAVALLGIYTRPALVVALFIAVGITSIFVDVPAYTLIQRATPNAVLGRVFGALEGLSVLGTAVGAGLAPLLVALFGLGGAFLALGCLVLVPSLLTWRAVQRLDAPEGVVGETDADDLPEQVQPV